MKIEAGLRRFVETYADQGIAQVAFPQLGCGNGGLDWEGQVRPLMERYLAGLPIDVFVHRYPSAGVRGHRVARRKAAPAARKGTDDG